MGMIATITANIDYLVYLGEERNLASKIKQAIDMASGGHQEEIGNTKMTVIGSHHADYAELVVIGGEQEGKYLGVSASLWDKNIEEQLLRKLADKHGYTLHRKPQRK